MSRNGVRPDLPNFYYSRRYVGDTGDSAETEFRFVVVPTSLAFKLRDRKLLDESEWRAHGIEMSSGWKHVAYYRGSTTLMFRRPIAQ